MDNSPPISYRTAAAVLPATAILVLVAITAARTIFSMRVEHHPADYEPPEPPNNPTFSSLALSANGFLAWLTTVAGSRRYRSTTPAAREPSTPA